MDITLEIIYRDFFGQTTQGPIWTLFHRLSVSSNILVIVMEIRKQHNLILWPNHLFEALTTEIAIIT
jgi:hypothetical protein